LRPSHVKLVVELGLSIWSDLVLIIIVVVWNLVLVSVQLLYELHLVNVCVCIQRRLHCVLALVLVNGWLLHLVVVGLLDLLLAGIVLQVRVGIGLVQLLGSLWLWRDTLRRVVLICVLLLSVLDLRHLILTTSLIEVLLVHRLLLGWTCHGQRRLIDLRV